MCTLPRPAIINKHLGQHNKISLRIFSIFFCGRLVAHRCQITNLTMKLKRRGENRHRLLVEIGPWLQLSIRGVHTIRNRVLAVMYV